MRPPPAGGERGALRIRAVAEVGLAFAAMHVAFRAFKRFTAWGRWETGAGMNFSPGLAMIAVALLAIALRPRRSPGERAPALRGRLAEHGLTLRPLGGSLDAALVALLVLGTLGAVLTAAGVPVREARDRWPAALAVALAGLAGTWLLLWLLRRLDPATAARAVHPARLLGLAALLALPAAPILLAWWQGRPVGRELLTILWVVVGAGIGEEVFFRGYVQSRLNGAFGRPWRLQGVAFGPGLLIASALFGLVHVLNPADYFAGVARFGWPHGLATCAALFYGFLRERTGSVLAPAVVHACIDLGGRLPQLLGGAAGGMQ